MELYFPTKKEKLILEKTIDLLKTEKNINTKFLMKHFKIGWALATRVVDQLKRDNLLK